MKSQTVYLYNETTKEFTHVYAAQESPLEPGVFIVPSHATKLAPPVAGINQVAVFSNGAWGLVADYRGTTWYDTTSGAITVINTIGTPASNLATTEPASVINAREQVSDVTILRCAEDGIAVPTTWITYRKNLRAIVSGADLVSTTLPAVPAYPNNS
jgi:hypothetical protein